ncbi:cytochrome c [Duganella sp. sic0402]|uniref:cytochrome c n=1 Tax=Duganella sp. sic0402 TaxID=2854786 RepID=UPI001C446E80|nr:cytochrome c [Duganella sp. sic0402]MBV7537741.1 cytochrome c [Duganella sp. sic0402]
MRKHTIRRATALAAFALLAACQQQTETVKPVAQVTLQDAMNHIIDPEADVIWHATGTIATKEGVIENYPRTEKDWEAQRRAALRLLEASNMLLIADRRVTDKPFESAGPGVYSSAEVQRQIDTNRSAFNALALNLRDASQQLLKASDKRDVESLMKLGDGLDHACEACHKTFWYPAEKFPRLPAIPPSP